MLELLTKFGLPEVASLHGPEVDAMLAIVHWLMLALFIGWGAFFLYTLFRFRASRNPQASYAGAQSHASTWVEVGVAVLETVLIIGFAMPLWAQRINDVPPKEDALQVNAIGQQFKWWFHYPGKDGVFGKRDVARISETNPIGLDRDDPNALDDLTTGMLRLPVDKPAVLYISSLDVIHSFTIQEMRVKQDAIPGMRIPMWFTPTVTTEEMRKMKVKNGTLTEEQAKKFRYEVGCAQLCGIGHAGMKGYADVQTEAQFLAWLENEQPTLGEGDEDDFFFE